MPSPAPAPSAPGIAFFDVDGTLVWGSSGMYLALYLFERRRLSLTSLFGAAYLHVLHAFGRLDPARMYRAAAEPFREADEAELREVAAEVVQRWMVPRLFGEGLRRIATHRERGERVVLLSSASVYIVEALAPLAGADGAIGARPDWQAGHVVGALPPWPYGPGKATLAEVEARAHGVPLTDCAAYGDALADLPLLAAVGRPVAVNPKRALLREAERRGWPVENWATQIGHRPGPPAATPGGGAQRPAGAPATRSSSYRAARSAGRP